MRNRTATVERLVERCLAAFVEAGSLDLSLDELARKVKTSKRMLVHYFGGREDIEEKALTLLEDRLRGRFAAGLYSPKMRPEAVVTALWNRAIAPESRGVLLLVMDLSRRAWNGSKRAQEFYAGQQRQWVDLLMKFFPDKQSVEEVLQLFQGAVLAYLITGDPGPGKRALARVAGSKHRNR